jgi:ABC-type transporter Mla subunit MlaD
MKEGSLETKVGFFVIAGLVATASLIVAFGKLGNYFRKTYPVIVEFEDARDILKNSKVLLRGADRNCFGHSDLSGGAKLRGVDPTDR